MALTELKMLRQSGTTKQGTWYTRVYAGPLDPSGDLPSVGDAMPTGSDCPGTTTVTSVRPRREGAAQRVVVQGIDPSVRS